MKSVILSVLLTLSWTLAANASIPQIEGESGIELYKVLTEDLNIKAYRNGDSPESGCYKIRYVQFMNMECYSAYCTQKGSFDRKFGASCYFDKVDSDNLNSIRTILREAGLNPENPIFK